MNSSSKKPVNGCIWIVLVTVATFIFFGIITLISSIPLVLSLIFALLSAIVLITLITGKPTFKSFIVNGIVILLVFVILKIALNNIISLIEPNSERITISDFEGVKKSTLIEGNDTIPVYQSIRVWKDNYGNNFKGDLSVREQDFLNLKDHISKYKPSSNQNFWGNLYDYIEKTDSPRLDLVIRTFELINAEKRLNQMEFAEMIVSCIQDIPYSFVFQEACRPAEDYDESYKYILDRCPECCIGNIMYGIQNPVSFVQNLKGDCDTRTVLIYSILKHFDYDVAILNSDYYRHSIIGLNLPVSGLKKIYNGRAYAVWETTSKNFEIGYLSPNFNNISYWDVVLTSK